MNKVLTPTPVGRFEHVLLQDATSPLPFNPIVQLCWTDTEDGHGTVLVSRDLRTHQEVDEAIAALKAALDVAAKRAKAALTAALSARF